MQISRYLINDKDQFSPHEFPQIEEDVNTLVAAMAELPAPQKTEMLLSFVRDRSMRSEWVSANPALAKMICTHSLPVKNLETLFASSSRNLLFRIQLEEYVAQKFKDSLAS